jgi:hypothetical protein
MIIPELYELKNLCLEMSQLGAASLAQIIAPAKDNVSQREAYRMFGEARVKNWIKRGLLNPIRNGESKRSKILYSRTEMLALVAGEQIKSVINNH